MIGVIPARWGSTRFPGKPVALILGKPMLQHVYERASKCKLLDEILIATDDERIREVAEGFGSKVAITSNEHLSGTDRVSEAVSGSQSPIVLNIQGDEPLLCSESVDRLAKEMISDPKVEIATLGCTAEDESDLSNPSCVKVVLDRNGDALYFSRSRIPYVVSNRTYDYCKHIGIYGFRREALLAFASSPRGSLETAEGLEQLRAVEQGIRIRVVMVPGWGPSVDLPEDIEKVEEILKGV